MGTLTLTPTPTLLSSKIKTRGTAKTPTIINTERMGSIETEHNPQSQSSLFPLDCLYCEEKCCDDEEDFGVSSLSSNFDSLSSDFDVSTPEEDEEQLLALFSKEEKITYFSQLHDARMTVMEVRRETLEWMKRVAARYDFSANTVVLAANYFDRIMVTFELRSELPWLTQLGAIACLSLASKIEETRSLRPPSLLDFQVDCKYIFEAKTIQRMELLVLSTLEWKMNPVTPLSFSSHLMKKLKLKNHQWEILCKFETLILSAIVDSRFLCYLPSVLAAATLVQALKELNLWDSLEHKIQIMKMFSMSQDKVDDCSKFIQELSSNNGSLKRKYVVSSASSPKNVLDLMLSDSPKESSISSLLYSPEPLCKKRR